MARKSVVGQNKEKGSVPFFTVIRKPQEKVIIEMYSPQEIRRREEFLINSIELQKAFNDLHWFKV